MIKRSRARPAHFTLRLTPIAVASLLCLLAPSALAAPTTDSLLGYWKFDETSGTSAADSSGDGHTGTLTNGPTISTDVPTTTFTNVRSLSFDGTDDYADLGDTGARSGTAAFTISVWAKPTGGNTSAATVLGRGSTTSNKREYFLYWASTNSRFEFQRSDGSSFPTITTGTNTAPSGSWYHIVATYDGSTMSLYLNGVLKATLASALSVTGSNRLTVGSEFDHGVNPSAPTYAYGGIVKRGRCKHRPETQAASVPLRCHFGLDAFYVLLRKL
jgi:hypothetical protein